MSYKEVRQTISKKDSACDKCGGQIKKGSPCVIDPKNKKIYHTGCIKTKSNDKDSSI
jgi:tartrate dehydratase beta subunit/fumarate hydratase class I family protein